jgi:hypothetical protein
MSLRSTWFRANARLQRCLEEDPAHVKQGDAGEHVRLVQSALVTVGHNAIAEGEQARQHYGVSTANAVLDYKTQRRIVNRSYQSVADNIVGKLTIRSLDDDMLLVEKAGSRLLLGFGATLSPPKIVLLTEPNNAHAVIWAKQMQAANSTGVTIVMAPAKATPEANLVIIKQAIAATNGGMLMFNVGHGSCLLDNRKSHPDEGAFDLAPGGTMRLQGKTTQQPTQFASEFYDEKHPGSNPESLRAEDEQSSSPAAKTRLKNFAFYEDLSRAFVSGGVGAVLLATCRVGGATGFLQRVATRWKTPIIAYSDQFMFYETQTRRTRAILAIDKGRANTASPGTDTPMGEILFPLSAFQMVSVRP